MSEPCRLGIGPFGREFSKPVQDQAIRVLESESRVCRLKIKLPRGIDAVSQCSEEFTTAAAVPVFPTSVFAAGLEWESGRL